MNNFILRVAYRNTCFKFSEFVGLKSGHSEMSGGCKVDARLRIRTARKRGSPYPCTCWRFPGQSWRDRNQDDCLCCAFRHSRHTQDRCFVRAAKPAAGSGLAITYTPTSSETKLLHEIADALSALHLCRSWYAFIPSRVGVSSASDSVIKAFVKAHQFRNTQNPLFYEQSLNHQADAVSQLRQTLDVSETSLLTVALLAMYEGFLRPQDMLWSYHQRGVVKILLARVQNGVCSDISRAIAYGFWGTSFRQACVSGEASPYDAPIWLQVEPAWCGQNPPQDVMRLRKRANQMMVRLPRLVALLRTLCECVENESGDKSTTATRDALDLALELLNREDRDAENALLHRVNVRKTVDAADAELVPHSFVFASADEIEAAVLYWMCRIHITQLCLNLSSVIKTSVESMPGHRSSLFDCDKLQEEKVRLCINIFMSWQYSRAFGALYGIQKATVLLLVYGALRNVSDVRGKPAKVVQEWILRKYTECTAFLPMQADEAQLDRTSRHLLGGELQGLMMEMEQIGEQVVVGR